MSDFKTPFGDEEVLSEKWAYQDFAAGVIISNSVTLTANENGLNAPFAVANIVGGRASIFRSDDLLSYVYTGATQIFSSKVYVTGLSGANVTLSGTPHSSYSVRIWYKINTDQPIYSYTIPPKVVSAAMMEKMADLILTEDEVGSKVQGWDAQLDDLADLAFTDGNMIVGNGSNWIVESGATLRTTLGLGLSSVPDFAGLNLSGLTASQIVVTDASKNLATISLDSFIPYTGAVSNVDLGSKNFTTTGISNLGYIYGTWIGDIIGAAKGGTGTGELTQYSLPIIGVGGTHTQDNDKLCFNTATFGLVIGADFNNSNMIVGGVALSAGISSHQEGTRIGMQARQYSNVSAEGANLYLGRAKGTLAAPNDVTTGNVLGRVVAAGYDGTDYENGAYIEFGVDGTPTAGNMPTYMSFGNYNIGEILKLSDTGVSTFEGDVEISGLTADELVATDGAGILQSLPVLTYPSLAQIAHVKGVTSAIQAQLDGKQSVFSLTANELVAANGAGVLQSLSLATYPSLAQIAHVKGVTSAIQTQLDSKQSVFSLTPNELVAANGSGVLQSLSLATYPNVTELAYVRGVSSAIQTQLNAKQAILTFGIGINNAVKVATSNINNGEYARFTSQGLESRTPLEVKYELGLNNVQNTALSGWAGSSSITTVGTLSSLKIGSTGVTISSFQHGKADIGGGSSGVNVYTINFPNTFSTVPRVRAEVVTQPGTTYQNVFASTIKETTVSGFKINVYRVDSLGASWGQLLDVHWEAIEG
jgi:hypothetical protein